MAITVNLAQISTAQYPAALFYSRVKYDSSGMYYDTITGTLKPLANASPRISFTEAPAGSGAWTWTLDFSTLPDGFYTIESYEATQNARAAVDKKMFLVAGATATDNAQAQVALTQNTGGTDNLTYLATNGTPISGATVRVYTSSDWLAQSLANPAGVTITDISGRWTEPVFVKAGATYYIQFHLTGQFGPDVVAITV